MKSQKLLQDIGYEYNNLSCKNNSCNFNRNDVCIDIDFYLDCEVNSIDIDIYENK